jgi:hypothetical protein
MKPDGIQEIEKKLAEINKVILNYDPAIRLAAFEILAPFYFDKEGQVIDRKRPVKGKENNVQKLSADDLEAFFKSFDHKKPKDNVLLIAAWLYSQYGVFPITTDDIKTYADKTGLTVPERSDNTMRSSKKKSKSLFRQQGAGWALTVHGEAHVKEVYGVKKGAKARPSETDA